MKTNIKTGILWGVITLSVLLGPTLMAELPNEITKPTEADAEIRAAELVSQMTLDEKLQLVSGFGDSRYDHLPVERLGIPPLLACDAGLGVRTSLLPDTVRSTGFQSGLSLAASFDEAAAEAQGRAIGVEAYLLGYGSILGPVPDAARTPYYGRNFEALGEDPFLAGKIAASETRGIQESPVIASNKHYTGNVQEWNRHSVNELIGERALREYYTRAWAIIVDEAQPGGIMAAFNSINGEACVDSYHLLTEILKDDFGHKGYVQTDFNGSTGVSNAIAGLDFEGPNTQYFGDVLREAVTNGIVPMERLDDMVYRWLRSLIVSAYFDHTPANALVELSDVEPISEEILSAHADLAYENATKGIVLLKNENNALPIGLDALSIALIGTDLDIDISGSGSASIPNTGNLVSVLDGVSARAAYNGATVEWVKGVDSFSPGDMLGGPATTVPSSAFRPFGAAPGVHGLTQYVYGSPTNNTPLVDASVVPQVNLASGIVNLFSNSFVNTPNFYPWNFGPHSISWFGKFTPPVSGTYTLYLHHMGGARLVLNAGVLIAQGAGEPQTDSATIDLNGGQSYDLEINYYMNAPAQLYNGSAGMFSDGGISKIRFAWDPPAGVLPTNIQEAVDAARSADVAVVCVRDFNTEAMDRQSLQLQQDQDRLISAVAAVNPRTIVVLQTGGPVLMPWLDEVEAVVEGWYSSQEQGDALAGILFGDLNPSGKLPITFPSSEDAQPINTLEGIHGVPTAPYPGYGPVPVNDFSEGVYVGYRGYDKAGIEPLFPFGYGLSYSTFEYSGGTISPSVFTPETEDRKATVSFHVTNTSERAGTEVAQVYIRFPAGIDMPEKQLVGFKRVSLEPGESQLVEITIDGESAARPFSMWYTSTNGWFTPPGNYQLLVGGSSEDLPLAVQLSVE
ncbi:beta-glucosidase [Coraliomargarita parva]|uniref:beta-glucosidase n=1 Tax=Coraliomargarita parva TaxID=3014050 RepID=UPI0022B32289|nr:glycoside hydrolase family 3 C-terminal domain-containing protein [Coraliomargarita parva]